MGNTTSKWYQHPAISITKKALSAVAKIFLTVLLVGVITVSLVVSVMAIYVSVNFDGSKDLPDLNQVN
ncbi:MAG: hypothetical protein J6K98_00135, partial [Clostridia bacterium]|nr:hypothetical protein [Clostridia bacterium]